MCGIAGLLNLRDDPIDGSLLRRMTETLAHRGPEATAVWLRGERSRGRSIGRPTVTRSMSSRDVPSSVGLGHTRLRIIDVAGGDQPIWNEDKSCLIVFNGEIYNFVELRRELEARGHRFTTATDTETILHAYEEWGEGCPEKLRGMFAFAIWDERRQALFLARDRMGIKPLLMVTRGSTLAFASEMKALLQDPELERLIDPGALSDYLSLGYVPGPGTMLEGIIALPAGHSLTLKMGQLPSAPRRYWQLTLGAARARPEAACLDELDELLRDVVGRHLLSDVPLGVFLSGGVDSSTLAVVAASLTATPLRTFSIGFPAQSGYNEAPFAREVARRLGAEHQECMLQPDALSALPQLTWHLDQPLADPSAIPLFHLCQMTRAHVTVALAGDGGDELFGGYEQGSYWDGMADRYARLPRFARERLIEPLLRRLPRLPLDVRRDPFRRARKFVQHAARPASSRYYHWFELMTPEFERQLLGEALRENGFGRNAHVLPESGVSCFERSFDEARKLGATPLDTMQYCDTQTMLRDDLLHKCDRISMAVALEARVPFLDHLMVEWAFSLPAEYRVHGRTLKYLLKRWLARHLPTELVYRRKQGFEVPLYQWLTGPGVGRDRIGGREWVRDLLLAQDSLDGGLFHRQGVQQLVGRLQNGERSLALPVYSLIAWEMWRRQFLEPVAARAVA